MSIHSQLARQNLQCVELTIVDESLLKESDDIEVFVEEVNLSYSEIIIIIIFFFLREFPGYGKINPTT